MKDEKKGKWKIFNQFHVLMKMKTLRVLEKCFIFLQQNIEVDYFAIFKLIDLQCLLSKLLLFNCWWTGRGEEWKRFGKKFHSFNTILIEAQLIRYNWCSFRCCFWSVNCPYIGQTFSLIFFASLLSTTCNDWRKIRWKRKFRLSHKIDLNNLIVCASC